MKQFQSSRVPSCQVGRIRRQDGRSVHGRFRSCLTIFGGHTHHHRSPSSFLVASLRIDVCIMFRKPLAPILSLAYSSISQSIIPELPSALRPGAPTTYRSNCAQQTTASLVIISAVQMLTLFQVLLQQEGQSCRRMSGYLRDYVSQSTATYDCFI